MRAKVVLLCEDRQTDAFVRRFLAPRFKGRQIQTLPLPAGRQSGEQWGRTRFPAQLKAIRQRVDAFLIVVVDAENLTTAVRRKQLDEACEADQVPTRNADDRALVLTPKRNIETWLARLGGDESAISEEAEHPKLLYCPGITVAVRTALAYPQSYARRGCAVLKTGTCVHLGSPVGHMSNVNVFERRHTTA